jgi:arabinoxylan arabinofuranohydrolase
MGPPRWRFYVGTRLLHTKMAPTTSTFRTPAVLNGTPPGKLAWPPAKARQKILNRRVISNLESLIDPCVFVDDDGQAYFYYGGGNVCKGGKLKDNMMEIEGEMKTMQGLNDFHEATWVHKKDGLYYLSYADNFSEAGKHNRMRYATSSNPLGPWTSKGVYIDPTDSFTNHGSIVEFKGQWYAFYHNSSLSNNDWLRSICVNKLYYNADGTIRKVIQTNLMGAKK